jgi:predicted GNAT superfamily acetyltransferase
VLVATPDDIVAMRQTQPDLAVRWRRAVRRAFSVAFDAGLEADLITTDGAYRFARAGRR